MPCDECYHRKFHKRTHPHPPREGAHPYPDRENQERPDQALENREKDAGQPLQITGTEHQN